MPEFINLFISYKEIVRRPSGNTLVPDRDNYIDINSYNPAPDTDEEYEKILLQSILNGDKKGALVNLIDIRPPNVEATILSLLARIGLKFSYQIVDVNPNKPDAEWGDKRITTRDVEVVFDGEESLDIKAAAITAIALLAVNTLELDHTSWIPF